jgi:hypothetical protein
MSRVSVKKMIELRSLWKYIPIYTKMNFKVNYVTF